MSNLSELLPAGAGAKSASFVASGTLGSGVTVALNSDGTVEAIGTVTEGFGSPSVFQLNNVQWVTSIFDSNSNKVVIAYRNPTNSNYGTAVVGTVSGTSISFGTAVVFQSSLIDYISITFDSTAHKIVIAYRNEDNLDYGTAIVGTVSGTSISFGSSVVFESANTTYIGTTFDAINGKVVIAYRDGGNADAGTAIIGTVSGASISFGSPSTFTTDVSDTALAFDSNAEKVVIIFRNNANLNYGTGVVGTVSGTSISFGSLAVFESADSAYNVVSFDSNSNKIVASYSDVGNSNYGTAVVGTVSGTSISFGTPVIFESAAITSLSSAFDSNANKVVISYKDTGNSNYGTAVVGTVSGTSISFNTPIVFENAAVDYTSAIYDATNKKVVISYRDIGGSLYGTSIVFQNAASNNTSFIGITDQAIAYTATGAVIVQGGVSDKVSSLTTGSDYYVQSNGTLSTTVSSVPAGRALSSTSILLEG